MTGEVFALLADHSILGRLMAPATTALPDTRSEIDGWQPERERLAQYRALVGSDAEVPLAYPQVPIMAVHMDLLSRWSHPVRAMGLVHQGSVVEALDELPTDQPWDLRAWGSAGRHVRSGMEWDMWGEVRVAGRLRWRSDWRSTHPDPVKIEREITVCFPPEEWTDLSHRLILFGRSTCHARTPDCANCPLAATCPSAGISTK